MYSFDELFEDLVINQISKEKAHKKYGGQQLYIPQVAYDYKNKIIEEFNGYNHHLLATKHNVSLSTVYRIIKENQDKSPTLFD
jgi:Mor family transcriptional regulator